MPGDVDFEEYHGKIRKKDDKKRDDKKKVSVDYLLRISQ